MDKKNILVLATGNRNKYKEIVEIIDLPGWEIKFLKDFPHISTPEETGTTYEENALIKAKSCAELLKYPSLSDDSGLEVDVLEGRPGVYSSSYGGVEGDSERNIQRLLSEMEGVPWHKRTARFICCAMLVLPNGFTHCEKGTIEGHIAIEPYGDNGFGYDPIFVPLGYENTFAELPPEEKNKISHRALAFQQMADFLRGFNYVDCSTR
ncbi:MAG: RdgB/HAM1 family non-canonical purine NTP pyrophosphatase [Candidatus Hydrogenedens sp.]